MEDCQVCVQTIPARFKQNRLNRIYLMNAQKSVGANGNRRIAAHHGPSSPILLTLPRMHEGLVGAKVAAEFESLILSFQVSHLFPVRAELLLARWGHVTASNLRNRVM